MRSTFRALFMVLFLTLLLAAGAASAEKTLFQQSREATFAKLGPAEKPAKPFRLGVVIVTQSNPFWVTMGKGYEAAAKEFGITADIQASPQENAITGQLNILETMVAKKYDIIAAHTITASNLIPGMVKATEQSIPIITDTRVDLKAAREAGAKPIAVGLVDFYTQGKTGAEYIVSQLKKKGGGKVAILEGMPGAPQSQGRTRGAKDAFNASDTVKLVSSQPADWDRNKAYTVTTNLIQAHPDLKGIMCANDIMALAAIEALKSAGKDKQVMVVGVDLIGQAKESIAAGELAGSVAFSPFVIGELITRVAVNVMAGKKIPEDLSVVSVLATKDNIHLLSDWK